MSKFDEWFKENAGNYSYDKGVAKFAEAAWLEGSKTAIKLYMVAFLASLDQEERQQLLTHYFCRYCSANLVDNNGNRSKCYCSYDD